MLPLLIFTVCATILGILFVYGIHLLFPPKETHIIRDLLDTKPEKPHRLTEGDELRAYWLLHGHHDHDIDDIDADDDIDDINEENCYRDIYIVDDRDLDDDYDDIDEDINEEYIEDDE